MMVKVHGKAKRYKDSWSFINPEIEPVRDVPLAVGDSIFSEDAEAK